MECGTPLTAPTVGTRNGYEFIGWVPEIPDIEENEWLTSDNDL